MATDNISIRQFPDDQRNNPKLHNFLVRQAYEDLEIAKEAISKLYERNRVPAGAMAFALKTAMVAEIQDSAEFFEAAALLFAGLEPPKDPEED